MIRMKSRKSPSTACLPTTYPPFNAKALEAKLATYTAKLRSTK